MSPFYGLQNEQYSREEILTIDIANTFGLLPEHRIAVLYEPIFLLMYYMGVTWESFGLGIMDLEQRRWFVERLNKEIEMARGKDGQNSTGDIPTKSAHMNDPQTREMLGKVKPFNRNPRTQRPGSNV